MIRWQQVKAADPPGMVVALVLATVVEIGLRTLRLPRLARSLGVPLAVGQQLCGDENDDLTALPHWARRRLAVSRRVLRHWPYGDSCLRQALVGGAMIRSLHPALRIGVTKRDGQVKAHAWLEIAGISLDPGSRDFATVERMAPQ